MTDSELRELDKQIHETIFGRKVRMFSPNFGNRSTLLMRDEDGNTPVPNYSTDIGAAWLIFEKLAQEKWVQVGVGISLFGPGAYVSSPNPDQLGTHPLVKRPSTVDAKTAPLAICLAALKAIAIEPNSKG